MTSKHFSILTFLISGSVFKLPPQTHVGTELEEDEGQLSLLGDQKRQSRASDHCSSLEGRVSRGLV